ncbi:MAG TPA: efflux transporter outer membrane subunit [Cyclobacteriaceae bacterium]|jgi:NodT family efflux transporter outer membrane factor (OMF) lipoprotein|nr:efflux transporter outer membrane subunit [Cyclobacteriaceae bacterium]
MQNKIVKYIGIIGLSLIYSACSVPTVVQKKENKNVPVSYKDSKDTINTAKIKWKDFFVDPYLNALIDTALRNNQELNIILQDIQIAQNEVRARKGAYLPFANIGGGVGVDKSSRYTREGAVDASNAEIEPGKPIPEVLPNYLLAANVSWEVDIWKKLRNARKSAVYSYLGTTAGKNFMVTHLIAEIANSFYELMALDNQLFIIKQNIEIQQNALAIVKLEKVAAKVTELAVRRFEAEVLKNQSRIFHIQQSIVETENRINFLVGRFPQPVLRNSWTFIDLKTDSLQSGIPAQLLQNRPDIKQAELDLEAAKLDVKVAKANFYPTLNITAVIGLQAFNPTYLVSKPESMMYNLGAGLFGPLINRNAIKASYYTASARQIQAAFNYERTILNAYIEVANQLSNINNLKNSYELRSKQVHTLTQSIDISTRLFRSARADYMEVLLTQRDALESKFELIETKKQQMNAKVNIYQALGGGWN